MLTCQSVARARRLAANARAGERDLRLAFQARVDHLLTAADGASAALRGVAEGILAAVGYHKHNRGEWRMNRRLKRLYQRVDAMNAALAKIGPPATPAPAGDADAAALFARARSGDAAAAGEVRRLIADRGWGERLGNLGRGASQGLIRAAAGGDPVREAAIAEAAAVQQRELLGPSPSTLDELLVRRVVNGWVAVHALELELAARPPADRRARDYLDRALTRAQKRMTDAIRELAKIRCLSLPAVLVRAAPPALPERGSACPVVDQGLDW